MIFWMTMSDLGPRTLPVYTVLSASSISSRMAGARFLARLVVNRSLWGDSACNVQGNVYTVICLRRIGFGCTGFALKFNDACFCQAEAVTPKRIRQASDVMVLGCSRSGSSRSVSSLHPPLCALTLVSAVSPFMAFVFRMLSNLMQCLLSGRFNG